MYFHNSIYYLYLDNSQIPNAKDLILKDTYIDEYICDVYSYNLSGCYVIEIKSNYYIDAKKYPRCYNGYGAYSRLLR
jgi:hypothetical protein